MNPDMPIEMRIKSECWGGILLALAVMAGCSSSPQGPRSAVTGIVTLDGAPLTAGTVLFMTEMGNAASADVKPDGTYALRCNPDLFKVAVTPPASIDPLTVPVGTPTSSSTSQPSIPKKYLDFGTSGLSAEIKKGDNTFDIALSR
jgi:hypothetical protein